MSDNIKHEIMGGRGPKRPINDFTKMGIRASDEEIAELQPQWDIPEKVAIMGDLGHHLYADEVVEEAKASIRAGASSLHLHIKDDKGSPTGDREIWTSVIDRIREEDPNIVIDAGLRGETFEEQMYYIREGYFDVVPISQGRKVEYYEDVLEVIESHGAKPRLTVFTPGDIVRAYARYIKPGLIETPAIWAPMIGNPYHGVFMPNQNYMIDILKYMIDSIEYIDPGAKMLVTASNRPSSYLAAQTAILGQHIRLGMGESRWRHPHKDEKLEDNETMISDASAACRALGREPMDSTEYRELVGLD